MGRRGGSHSIEANGRRDRDRVWSGDGEKCSQRDAAGHPARPRSRLCGWYCPSPPAGGPSPLRIDDKTPTRSLPHVPIDAFSASEFGVFPPRPPRDGGREPWTIAVGPSRPNQTWRKTESQFFNAEAPRLPDHEARVRRLGPASRWDRLAVLGVGLGLDPERRCAKSIG